MTDLNDWVESLKRAVAPPGEFETYYPDSTDDDLVGYLLDAFGAAQLDGFFTSGWGATDAGIVTPDLNRGNAALLVIFAAVRIIQTQLLNFKNEVKYEAAGAIFETKTSSNVLTSILKQLNDKKAEISLRLRTNSAASAFAMADSYFINATTRGYYGIGTATDRAYDYNAGFDYADTGW